MSRRIYMGENAVMMDMQVHLPLKMEPLKWPADFKDKSYDTGK
ncbi:MAG TPA: hypothetical protein VFK33_16905 [Bacillales bacterium]|nr:hypothetical protein [Bacillales bacterium]